MARMHQKKLENKKPMFGGSGATNYGDGILTEDRTVDKN